jgi:spore germination protein
MTTITVGAVIGVGVLAFPRIVIDSAGTGGPLATLLGAIPATFAWLAYVKLSRRFRGRSPAEYASQILTRPIGWLFLSSIIIFKITITAMAAREFGEVLKTAVLPNTPIEVTIITMLLAAAYFVRYDVQVFARVYEVFFLVMLVPLTIIGLLSLTNARLYHLMPLTGISWQGVLNGAMMASVGYVAVMVVAFVLPSLNRPKQAVKAGLWGLGLSAFVYLLAITASLSVFGSEEMKRMVWPTYELIKTTTVPGFILERLESAFIGIWVAAVFTTVAATYYPILLICSQWFGLRDHKVMAIPLVPILYMVALAPPDIHTLYRFLATVGLGGAVLNQVMPLLMLLIAYLRGKGAVSRARQLQ